MIPDKCPQCGAPAWHSDAESTDYECGSSIRSSDTTLLRTTLDELDPCAVKALELQRDQLAARVKRLEDAGDAMATEVVLSTANAWRKAKEANP